MQERNVSQRQACKEISISGSILTYKLKQPDKDKALIESIKTPSVKSIPASISTHHLIDTLSRLMTLHGRPKFIRNDNGPEFTAHALIKWLTDNNIGPAFIKPGSPWQNAYVESSGMNA